MRKEERPSSPDSGTRSSCPEVFCKYLAFWLTFVEWHRATISCYHSERNLRGTKSFVQNIKKQYINILLKGMQQKLQAEKKARENLLNTFWTTKWPMQLKPRNLHFAKGVRIRSFYGVNFIRRVNLRIQSECGKIRTRETRKLFTQC